MTNSIEISETTPPPFVLSSTVTVSFTMEQLVAIALETLASNGHEFEESTVKSTFTKGSLTLTVESSIGKEKPKARRKAAKKVAKKVTKKVAPPEDTKPEETPVETPGKTEETPVNDAPVVEKGNNPFPSSTGSNEEAIANVKAEAGVPEVAAFSTETSEVTAADTGEAPAFDFANIGND